MLELEKVQKKITFLKQRHFDHVNKPARYLAYCLGERERKKSNDV